MEYLVIAALLGLIPAAIASSKGRQFGLWWFYGFLLFFVALVHSLFIEKTVDSIERKKMREGFVKCPFCAEMIKPEAIKCKHCGSNVKDAMQAIRPKKFKPSDMPFDAFFIRNKDGFDVNERSVDTLVSRLMHANPDMLPINIKETYREEIEELKNQLPSSIRDDFIRIYSAKLVW